MTKENFKKTLQRGLDSFDAFVGEKKLKLDDLLIDHVGYKCSSTGEYEEIRKLFEFDEKFIYQSMISKRRISCIGLAAPLSATCGNVFYIELSDQKSDESQISGCDHLEFISETITYEEMLDRFSTVGLPVVESVKPHHSTHDVRLPNGFKIKLSRERLVQKISRDEFILV